MGLYSEGESVGIIMAILGAIILLAIYRVQRGQLPIVGAGACAQLRDRLELAPSGRRHAPRRGRIESEAVNAFT